MVKQPPEAGGTHLAGSQSEQDSSSPASDLIDTFFSILNSLLEISSKLADEYLEFIKDPNNFDWIELIIAHQSFMEGR